MHLFFKQYADSTIILEFPKYEDDPAVYQVLSKDKGFVNGFKYQPIDTTYRNVSNRSKSMAPEFFAQLSARKMLYKLRPADINIFFKMTQTKTDSLKNLWQSITKMQLWRMQDDRDYPACSEGSTFATVTDGGYIIIHLITRDKIKTLFYYAPEFYEEQCPGNEHRKNALNLAVLFEKYIPLERKIWR
ncbi:hypothetical protein [Pedobacter sp. BMA]|uniref:hypothetical protein n=1 Tax=Pedobacter sp. BMA TaxID=1663685 RepID=UPI0012E00185|nr:hypothetical protein [Pedobacter sp. BMA]